MSCIIVINQSNPLFDVNSQEETSTVVNPPNPGHEPNDVLIWLPALIYYL